MRPDFPLPVYLGSGHVFSFVSVGDMCLVVCVVLGSDNAEMCRAFCEETSSTNPASDERFVIRCRVILGDTKVVFLLDLSSLLSSQQEQHMACRKCSCNKSQ